MLASSLTRYAREFADALAPTTKQSDEMHESTGSQTQYTNTEKLVDLLLKERRTEVLVKVLGTTIPLLKLLGGNTTRESHEPRALARGEMILIAVYMCFY
jgi:hypothetical protein